MRRLAILFSSLFIIYGCGQVSEKKPSISIDDMDQITADLEIKDVSILESNSSNLLGVSLQVKRNQNNFWILDTDIRDAIHGFTKKGKYIGMVSNVGEDPGSVPSISDFILTGDTLKVLTSLGDRVLITSFSENNFKYAAQEIPYNCFSFEQIDSNFWIYSGYNKAAGSYRLRKLSADGMLLDAFLENESFGDGTLPFVEPSFFFGQDKLLLREALRPEILAVTNSGIHTELTIDFGKYQTPDEFWFMDPLEGFDRLNSRGFSTLGFIEETESYFFIEVQTQVANSSKKDFLILEKVSGKWRRISVNEAEFGHFYNPIGIEGDKIIFISYASYVVQNFEKLNVSGETQNHLKQVDESDNPVILYAQIPQFY